MALQTHYVDPQDWRQDYTAAFAVDFLAWTGCASGEMSTSMPRGRHGWAYHRNPRVDGFLKSENDSFQSTSSTCARVLFGDQGISPQESMAKAQTEALREKFNTLVAWWRNDTRFSSSSEEKILHPAYQTIMTMGKVAVPLVLENLESSRGHWFWALHFMTGSDPVPEGANISEAREAWLAWGRQERLLS